MRLNTKGRYAVMAMADIAKHGDGKAIPMAQIAERQQISLPYLEQLFAKLRQSELVNSARGPGGGYVLSRPADQIFVGEIMRAVGEPVKMTRCEHAVSGGCLNGEDCLTHTLWSALSDHIYAFLGSISLQDVIDKKAAPFGKLTAHLPADKDSMPGPQSDTAATGVVMRDRVYLDHNATSPLSPRVEEAMREAMGACGNPSSVHTEGRQARALVETAREKIAAMLGAEASDVTFTGSGTEANAAALSPGLVAKSETDRARALCFVSAVEHPSVLSGGGSRRKQLRYIPVNEAGVVDLDAFIATLEANGIDRRGATGGNPPFIVSVMLANNETGALQPVTEIAGWCWSAAA